MARRVAAGRMEAAPLLDGANEIAQQSERAADIIRNIRAFARKRLSDRQTFELIEAVEEAVMMFVAAHPQACPVWRTAPVGGSTSVLGDPIHLQQVMLNLLKNAWDAQCAAGRAHAPIELRFEESGGNWRLEVCDCGCGLAAEQFERLFEPFFTTKPDGLGLGLSLSKSIIESIGGTLSARPNDNKPGLTVWFSLPRHDAASPGVVRAARPLAITDAERET